MERDNEFTKRILNCELTEASLGLALAQKHYWLKLYDEVFPLPGTTQPLHYNAMIRPLNSRPDKEDRIFYCSKISYQDALEGVAYGFAQAVAEQNEHVTAWLNA